MPTSGADTEVQADFARYLLVLTAGFLENCVEAILLDFTRKRSAPEVVFYVERQLANWTNPNCEKIKTIFGLFKADWRDQLEAFLIDEKKDRINGLVALRHRVAHGEYVGTTLSQAKEYYGSALAVVQFMLEMVEPKPGV
jgi:RiboL-PSP-HEPN